jgi:hypothetical protein
VIWHTVFGVERGFDVALSPPHLTLKFAAILIGSAPHGGTHCPKNRGFISMVMTAAFVHQQRTSPTHNLLSFDGVPGRCGGGH